MLSQTALCDKGVGQFAEPPWDTESPEWRAIDEGLAEDDLARQVDAAVNVLNLEELVATYAGRGSTPLRPDLLLKLVLFEMHCGVPSPAHWCRDARNNDPLKWLLFGMRPSRAVLYDFRSRLRPLWDAWNREVLARAGQQEGVGKRTALDGTLIAALASRHRLINSTKLSERTKTLEEVVAADHEAEPPETRPRWMANYPETRQQQLDRYHRAQTRMAQLQAENQKRASSKRKKPEKILVSVSDPETCVGRDKFKVFRPLYNVQLMHDMDSEFITAYEVFDCQNDAGLIGVMLERCLQLVGRLPEMVLADCAYAGGADLAVCVQAGVTLYAPIHENDFSDPKRRQQDRPQIPKKEFAWLPTQQAYRCPEGHLLLQGRTRSVPRAGDRTALETTYRCPPEHCQGCIRREECTPRPEAGRTVSRLEHEDLLDELRRRMETPEAKALYKLRRQTIELRYADIKQHRNIRCFHGYGLPQARGEIAAAVLVHNLLLLLRKQQIDNTHDEPPRIPEQSPS
jgi:transposase